MRKILLILLALLLTSCGAPATQIAERAADSSAPAELSPEVLASPTLPQPTPTVVEPSVVPSPSSTSGPTATETSLPPLELPTPLANSPALLAWDGEPTYLGDSKPGFFFRVKYDPEIWALTTDSYGFPAIGHRGIEYCVISTATGRGLPSNMNVDHDVRKLGTMEFEISTAYLNGARRFVTYLGGDANIYTGFEVTFKEEADLCIQEAEVVLATLASVQTSQATPIP
ncbi:MAG: hypothetical protein HZB19_02400 [Chloroflexi bacterium]|nr:hypothetical protein [Chloroflexota bacterium]